MKQQTLTIRAGEVLRIKKLAAVVEGGVAELKAPPGRQLVVLVLGVSDPGAPFHVEPMLGALGYLPGGEYPAIPASEE